MGGRHRLTASQTASCINGMQAPGGRDRRGCVVYVEPSRLAAPGACARGVGAVKQPEALCLCHLETHNLCEPAFPAQETLALYFHSKYSVKEAQSLVRIPETLVCCMEFIAMPTPR